MMWRPFEQDQTEIVRLTKERDALRVVLQQEIDARIAAESRVLDADGLRVRLAEAEDRLALCPKSWEAEINAARVIDAALTSATLSSPAPGLARVEWGWAALATRLMAALEENREHFRAAPAMRAELARLQGVVGEEDHALIGDLLDRHKAAGRALGERLTEAATGCDAWRRAAEAFVAAVAEVWNGEFHPLLEDAQDAYNAARALEKARGNEPAGLGVLTGIPAAPTPGIAPLGTTPGGYDPPTAETPAQPAAATKHGPYSIGSAHWPGVSKIIEEMGELAQVLGKLIALGGEAAHWDGTDLHERMREEIADVQAALSFFVDTNGLERARISSRKCEKETLFRRWHQEQGGTTPRGYEVAQPAQPAPATAYRPGLPTIEQVRAHLLRGGRWQKLVDEATIVGLVISEAGDPRSSSLDRRARIMEVNPAMAYNRVYGECMGEACSTPHIWWRPCSPDGTPCAWPDESAPTAAPTTPPEPAPAADWNRCPKCNGLVDATDITDGSDVRCHACVLTLVCVALAGGGWRLDVAAVPARSWDAAREAAARVHAFSRRPAVVGDVLAAINRRDPAAAHASIDDTEKAAQYALLWWAPPCDLTDLARAIESLRAVTPLPETDPIPQGQEDDHDVTQRDPWISLRQRAEEALSLAQGYDAVRRSTQAIVDSIRDKEEPHQIKGWCTEAQIAAQEARYWLRADGHTSSYAKAILDIAQMAGALR